MKANELGFQEMATIVSPHGYIRATESLKYSYLINMDTSPSRAVLEVFKFSPSDGCPGDRTLLSLDASLAILTRVLLFEVSRLRHRTPVRPMLLTGQTGPMLLHLRLRFFGLGFVDQPRNPLVFW
jgi:hypothetical protein